MVQQSQSMKMVFVLLVSAIVCGIATFLVIVLLLNRNSEPSIAVRSGPGTNLAPSTALTLDSDDGGWGLLGSVPVTEIEAVNTPVPGMTDDTNAVGAALTTLPTALTTLSEVILVDYHVQPGDTLYSISQTENTSIDLMAVYGISSGDLVAGGVISLPVANPAFCPAMVPYLVHDGDTVFSIAQRFNSTKEAIASVNQLDNAFTIRTAEVLCIP